MYREDGLVGTVVPTKREEGLARFLRKREPPFVWDPTIGVGSLPRSSPQFVHVMNGAGHQLSLLTPAQARELAAHLVAAPDICEAKL
jgi:hypothetical protein